MTDKIRNYFVVRVIKVPPNIDCEKFLGCEHIVYSGIGYERDRWFCKDRVNGYQGITIRKQFCKVLYKYNWPKKIRGVRQVRQL